MTNWVILAPIGFQPAAVLAPLLAVKIKSNDMIVYLGSPGERGTARYAARIDAFLNGKGTSHRSCTVQASPSELTDAELQQVRERCQDHPVWYLVNGGRVRWMLRLLAALRLGDLKLFGNRGRKGQVLDSRGDLVEQFDVPSIGRDDLLRFLGLQYDGGELTNGTETLEGVENLYESAGQLYAIVRIAPPKLRNYRRLLVWQGMQRLGLELRRLLLVGAGGALLRRAKQDGVPVEDRSLRKAGWVRAVRDGTAAGLPERRLAAGRPVSSRNQQGSWTGRPLGVIMGTQPGTTLLAVWAHRPAKLYLLYDVSQPLCRRGVGLLQEDPAVGASEIVALGIRGTAPPGGATLHGDGGPAVSTLSNLLEGMDEDTVVNLTPGDKLFQSALALFALSSGREIWELRGADVLRVDSAPSRAPGEPVPLKTWLDLHAPATVQPLGAHWEARHTPEPILSHMAKVVLQRLAASPRNRTQLGWLWNRRRGLWVQLGAHPTLHADGQSWRLAALAACHGCSGIDAAFLPRNGGSNGSWFDWVAGISLASSGVDEVMADVRIAWPGGEEGIHFRDELDIVTRHQGQYGHWECKTTYLAKRQGNVSTRADLHDLVMDARARADRILGRRTLAVVVVPWVPDDLRRVPPGFEKREAGHLFYPRLGHVVDARFLLGGQDAVQSLACER